MKNKMMGLLTAILLCGLFSTAVSAQVLIGSYRVDDGPHWINDPPTYSCLEACAEVFGGASADYECSTSDSSIDNQALASVYGVASCAIVDEDAKSDVYNQTGHISAYVDDNCFGQTDVNYCYAADVAPPTPLPTEPVPTMGGASLVALYLLMLFAAALGFKGVFRKLR